VLITVDGVGKDGIGAGAGICWPGEPLLKCEKRPAATVSPVSPFVAVWPPAVSQALVHAASSAVAMGLLTSVLPPVISMMISTPSTSIPSVYSPCPSASNTIRSLMSSYLLVKASRASNLRSIEPSASTLEMAERSTRLMTSGNDQSSSLLKDRMSLSKSAVLLSGAVVGIVRSGG
jgi:hypothetical protein